MNSYLFIEYPKCSTCRKAKQFLANQGVSFLDRHIVEETPSVEELKQWLSHSSIPLKKLFNTSGQVYRSLQLKEKLETMEEAEQLALLASNGMLLKRPMLIKDGQLLAVGFQEENWRNLLKL